MGRLKDIIIGKARKPTEPEVFRKVSLVVFLAWIGLGVDGISSSCYGPEEGFLALLGHNYLGIFLALMTTVTVFVISASYMQIIELFPYGGGGYLVASKLLSPTLGMLSGCALVVDYVLTVTVSIASGADAVFSFLSVKWHAYKLLSAMAVLLILIILNLRGVKESVIPIIPVFLMFLVTHVVVIFFAIFTHLGYFPSLLEQTAVDIRGSVMQIGFLGVLFMLLHAYSLGGGTYTGIEAVSNALPILREPRVETGKKTMIFMAVSLAFTASGLIIGYLFYRVVPQAGKTLNSVLFAEVTRGWPGSWIFVTTTLFSEALILLVAAQTGFLDGPRVTANMAMDGWMPSRFSLLSDRLVTQNGILLVGLASMILMWFSKGAVRFLVVLYSINVFFTFSLSQLGMVKYWWKVRHQQPRWCQKIFINGIGLLLTSFILVTVVIIKFHEGGWLTIVVTTSLVVVAVLVKQHYIKTSKLLKRLDALLKSTLPAPDKIKPQIPPAAKLTAATQKTEHTAILPVNGFTGFGLHTLFSVLRTFPEQFKNFVFMQVGLIDAGRFKGVEEIENLRQKVNNDLTQYVKLMKSHGYAAESISSLGTDVVDELEKMTLEVIKRFPNSVLFTGQLVFPKETIFTRFLHNYTAFALQKRLYPKGIPVLILPTRV